MGRNAAGLAILALMGCAAGNNLEPTGTGGSGGSTTSSTSTTATSTTSGTGGDTTSSTSTGTGGAGGSGGATTSTSGTGGMMSKCGNGVIDLGEQCDGANLAGRSCGTEGFSGGTLGCNPDCTLDTKLCGECNDGVIEASLGEDCDFDQSHNPIISDTCQSLGFNTPGAPACALNCKYDLTPCACGDGMVEAGEECDGSDFGGKSCTTQGFTAGMLSCDASCKLVTIGCTKCGNGVIEAGEVCDASNLNGHTCMTEGFTGGTLACSPTCGLDTSGCTAGTCDPDGVYAITMGGPVSYSCCAGLVSVNVSQFVFSSDGAMVDSSPSDPITMSGAATTCPSGSFNVTGSIAGGCTEHYTLKGTFTDPDTWTGTYQLTFTGSQCSCFGGALGTPCVNQAFPITAHR